MPLKIVYIPVSSSDEFIPVTHYCGDVIPSHDDGLNKVRCAELINPFQKENNRQGVTPRSVDSYRRWLADQPGIKRFIWNLPTNAVLAGWGIPGCCHCEEIAYIHGLMQCEVRPEPLPYPDPHFNPLSEHTCATPIRTTSMLPPPPER